MSEGMRLKDQPASERPRERLEAHGPNALSHAELIAILLRTGLKGTNAVEAKKIIDDSGLKVFSAILLKEAAEKVNEVLKK